MDSEEKMDLRVRRTRLFIRDAFFKLIEEKGFDAITIQDITEQAMINRSTFYRHYQDKHDLARRCLDETFSGLLERLENDLSAQDVSSAEPSRNFRILFHHIEENADLYRLLFGKNGISIFISRLREYIIQLLRYRLRSMPQEQQEGVLPQELFEEYLAGAYLGVIQWWLDHMYEQPAEKVASWLYQLVVQGTNTALGFGGNK